MLRGSHHQYLPEGGEGGFFESDLQRGIRRQEQYPAQHLQHQIRINFFNNSKIRVNSFQFNDAGHALVVLQDGRAAVIVHSSPSWNNNQYKPIDLNHLTKEKIDLACFVSKNMVITLVDSKMVSFDVAEGSKISSHKLTLQHISEIHGNAIEKDKIKLFLVGNYEVNVLEMGKKKITMTHAVKFDHFVNQTFFYHQLFFVVTQNAIVKVSSISYEQTNIYEFTEACELTHIDELGNFGKKSHKNNRQSLWLVDSTSNGVYIGLTIRRNGNYKEGRLLVFECSLTNQIERLVTNIKGNRGYIETSDAVFIQKGKEDKQILQEFASLSKRQPDLNGILLTQEEYYVVSINLGHAFQGKQIAKQKVVEKSLSIRFEKLVPLKKRLDYTQLTQ